MQGGLFRSTGEHRHFKLAFHEGVSQTVLRRCDKALAERASSRQPPDFDWGMHFGNMSGEGAFLLIAYKDEHTTTWPLARKTLMRYIGLICDEWDLCVLERDGASGAPSQVGRALQTALDDPSGEELADVLESLSQAQLDKLAAATQCEQKVRAEFNALVPAPRQRCSEFGRTLSAELAVFGGSDSLACERGTCCLLEGAMDEELRSWLAADEHLHNPEFWRHAAWHGEPPGENWQFEAGLKCAIAGHLGEGSLANSVNSLGTDAPSDFTRNSAFVRALLKKNATQFNTLQPGFQRALAEDKSPNAREVCSSNVEQYLFNNLQLNAMSARFKELVPHWGLSPHPDGSAGMLLLAYQVVGAREMGLRQENGDELVLQCFPGHVYICNVATAFHQVRIVPHKSCRESGRVPPYRLRRAYARWGTNPPYDRREVNFQPGRLIFSLGHRFSAWEVDFQLGT